MRSAINIAAMSHGNKEQLVPFHIKLIDDAVVAHSHPKFWSALQAHMRVIFQTTAQITYGCLHRRSCARREIEKNRVKIAAVYLCGLVHQGSRLGDADLTSRQLCFSTLNAGNKLWIQFSLIFQIICQPVLKLSSFIFRQGKDLVLDGFKGRHMASMFAHDLRRIGRFCNPLHLSLP